MTYLNKNIKDRIDKKLKELNKLRPLPAVAVKKLQEQFRIEMTYNSNAIEGNSLTLRETELVINKGITVKGKPLKDHLEARDHYDALEHLYDLIRKKRKDFISEDLICKLHQLIVSKTDKEWAGRYRNSGVRIFGARHIPPAAHKIQGLMNDYLKWKRNNKTKLHLVELAALSHHRFVYIHPFYDGNGRTARLLTNLILMRAGYPLVVILKNDRKKYYQVLAQADSGNYSPLVKFVAQAVERSLDIYLKTLSLSSKRRENFLTLSKVASKTPYSAKYLNLLVRKGKLEAHKEGRNWVTSKKAIERYIETRQRKR